LLWSFCLSPVYLFRFTGNMATQLAARMHGNSDLRVEQVPILPLAAGEVKVRVAYAGICGSDLHEVYHGPQTTCVCGSPHPLTGQTLPMTLGHEFSGTIAEVHPETSSRLKVGDKVCIEPIISCLECPNCLANLRPLCSKRIGFFGYNRPGGLAPFVNVTEKNCHVVPDGIPLDIAAMAEPLSVAWHAVRRARLQGDEKVLVLGSGPIGALITRVLKAQGIKFIAVSEPSSARAAIAKQCGADAVFNPMQQDVIAECKNLTDGRGVDVSFDCAGHQSTWEAALGATKTRGRIVVVALWSKAASTDMFKFVLSEQEVTGSCCFTSEDMQEVLQALSKGSIKVDDLITGRIDLENIMKDGLEALMNEQRHVKILVNLEKQKVSV